MDTSFSDLAHQLSDFAAEGALSVASYLRGAARTVTTYQTKRDHHDPVTLHDRYVERQLHEYFGAAVPGSRVLGEEMGEQQLPGHLDAELVTTASCLGERVRWIIDPIDGTANFAAGSAYFGTSVAAELDGKIVAGAVSIPMAEEIFVADLESAWHLDRFQTRTELRAEGPTDESQSVLACYYPSARNLNEDEIGSAARLRRLSNAHMAMRRPGAGALDLAHVAAGWSGGLLGMSFGPWDVAAGIHLVKTAGGQVWNPALGTGFPEGLRPGVLATPSTYEPVTARAVLEEVADSLVDNGSQERRQ